MDKDTRNAIERATQRARKLLEDDFASQLEGTFDVLRSGAVAPKAGSHLTPRQVVQRDKIVAAIEHKRAAGMGAADAVADYLRDAAFTTLNRFAALKMLEARELVQECITKGEQSAGYRELTQDTGTSRNGVAQLPERAGYRLYIESLFDELSTEVKVLFDRRDPSSVLWPKRATFDQLLEILNTSELARVWAEDETIGWVYQFFNGADERKKMRDESQAPRNSRELAVRNQFFTPRYVVQFLTDNTLGRTWLEMHGQGSRLSEQCHYLVRTGDQPTRTRPSKDPRDLRVLDPACGSGHFLLYCFDLLLTIYEEAWAARSSAAQSTTSNKHLRDDYPDLADLRIAIPALILEYNLHGVDIDPRAAQIAALALWLRAQRAWKDYRVPAADRPRIRTAHIVVAEPMPADAALVEDFASRLNPPLLRALFKKMVAEMQLAGDLGTLVPVQQGIATELHQAREQFGKQRNRTKFLPGMEPARTQEEFDMSGIDDDSFFHEAETAIVEALRLYDEVGVGGASVRRRLFADDAGQGVALIDLLRKRFDVILMNPPFGETTPQAYPALKKHFPTAFHDLLAAFIQRAVELHGSAVGALTSEACLYGKMLSQWRKDWLLPRLELLADLGDGVLDSAVVRAVALVLVDNPSRSILFIDAIDDKGALSEAANGRLSYRHDREVFGHFPHASILFRLDPAIRALFYDHATFEPAAGLVKHGLTTYDDERFLRLAWEVDPSSLGRGRRWVPIAKGGNSETFYPDTHLVVLWDADGYEMGRHNERLYGGDAQSRRGSRYYFRQGLTFGRAAGRWFAAKPLNATTLFTDKGPAVLGAPNVAAAAVLGFLNSDPVRYLLHAQAQGGGGRTLHVEPGLVKQLPWPRLGDDEMRILAEQALRAWNARAGQNRLLEQDPYFSPSNLLSYADLRQAHSSVVRLLTANDADVADAVSIISMVVGKAFGIANDALRLFPPRDQHRAQESSRLNRLDAYAGAVLSACVGVSFGRFLLDSAAIGVPADPWNDQFPLCGQYSPDRQSDPTDRRRSILHDDPGSADDVIAGVAQVLAALGWNVEDLASIQGCELREWIAKRFFYLHLQQYSRSRRKAPIYWQLATPSASYSVWLYIHAFGKDTLFRVQNDYVVPKLAHEERRREALNSELRDGATAPQRKALAAQEALVEELRAFLDEVKRVAPLWKPNLDDGVIINFAPLWRLVPHHKPWQKELKATWDALCDAKYDWAHLAMHLWPERVVPKCATDRSLAIAHGLEDVFWVEGSNGKWTARKTPTRPVEELVGERTSSAVKAALKSLLEAPVAQGGSGRGRGGRRRAAASADEGGSR